MTSGFEICEEVAATAGGFEARVTAWAPNRAAYEAKHPDARRWCLPAATSGPRDYAADAASTLGRILGDFLFKKYGGPIRHVAGPALKPGEACP